MKDSKPSSTVGSEGVSIKELTCWAKFKRFFDDRGFDLECEYKDVNSVRTVAAIPNTNGYRPFEDINKKVEFKSNKRVSRIDKSEDTSGVVNFYDQLASLNDDTKENELWKRSAVNSRRVSVRPSISLTKIAEEIVSDLEMDDIEEVSCLLIVSA